MRTPLSGINKSYKDLWLCIRSADCFILISILADHGCNYIENQLLFVFTQTDNAHWFQWNDMDVNESKMWPFCFITQQNHSASIPNTSRQTDSVLSVSYAPCFSGNRDTFEVILILGIQLLLLGTAFSCFLYLVNDISNFIV